MKQSTLPTTWTAKLARPLVHSVASSSKPAPESPQLPVVKVIYQPSNEDSTFLPDFNLEAGSYWVYPSNFTVREYQFKITQECLFKNTLVCLPTGLGKTFIAAVVMQNFHRWYPQKKIIFIAPTRPLVAQQLIACREISGLTTESGVIEMTGTIPQNTRRAHWDRNKFFFLTPQILVNDIVGGLCRAEDICCLILDEAHKATGNHAYCQTVEHVMRATRQCRIIGLTATPGSDIQAVQEVIDKLHISHIELRTDECPDVLQYSHEREVTKIIVPLGVELSDVKEKLESLLKVYFDRLKMRKAIYDNCQPRTFSKFMLIKAREDFFASDRGKSIPSQFAGSLHRDFSVSISLLHAHELLQQHGLHPVVHFLRDVLNGTKGNSMTKAALERSEEFQQLWATLQSRFSHAEASVGHPKVAKLLEVLRSHFEEYARRQTPTKVIVFTQFRDSVSEITHHLQNDTLIKPVAFVGQSGKHGGQEGENGEPQRIFLAQKDQLRVLREFRDGVHNTLVSTCVGEEGLDIGEVDLIVCFDAYRSPIRLIQRIGRTGRKRQGRIVMLLAEGKEERNYSTSLSKKNTIYRIILKDYRKLHFNVNSARMVPLGVEPQPKLVEVAPPPPEGPIVSKKRKSAKVSAQDDRTALLALHAEQHQVTLSGVEKMLITRNSTLASLPPPPDVEVSRCLLKQPQILAREQRNLVNLCPCGPIVGHSELTQHVVNVERMMEMHRRGTTNLIFHVAGGRRSLPLDVPLSQASDVEEDEDSHPMAPTWNDTHPAGLSVTTTNCTSTLKLDDSPSPVFGCTQVPVDDRSVEASDWKSTIHPLFHVVRGRAYLRNNVTHVDPPAVEDVPQINPDDTLTFVDPGVEVEEVAMFMEVLTPPDAVVEEHTRDSSSTVEPIGVEEDVDMEKVICQMEQDYHNFLLTQRPAAAVASTPVRKWTNISLVRDSFTQDFDLMSKCDLFDDDLPSPLTERVTEVGHVSPVLSRPSSSPERRVPEVVPPPDHEWDEWDNDELERVFTQMDRLERQHLQKVPKTPSPITIQAEEEPRPWSNIRLSISHAELNFTQAFDLVNNCDLLQENSPEPTEETHQPLGNTSYHILSRFHLPEKGNSSAGLDEWSFQVSLELAELLDGGTGPPLQPENPVDSSPVLGTNSQRLWNPATSPSRTQNLRRSSTSRLVADDDDDFIVPPPKRKRRPLLVSPLNSPDTIRPAPPEPSSRLRPSARDFFLTQANVSSDAEHHNGDNDEEENLGNRYLLDTFLTDDGGLESSVTHPAHDESHTMYLRAMNEDRLRDLDQPLPSRPAPVPFESVFSQTVRHAEDSYELDSFCVASDESLGFVDDKDEDDEPTNLPVQGHTRSGARFHRATQHFTFQRPLCKRTKRQVKLADIDSHSDASD